MQKKVAELKQPNHFIIYKRNVIFIRQTIGETNYISCNRLKKKHSLVVRAVGL